MYIRLVRYGLVHVSLWGLGCKYIIKQRLVFYPLPIMSLVNTSLWSVKQPVKLVLYGHTFS